MSDTASLWDEDAYNYDAGANYILKCGDADMAIDDTLDSHRLHWCEHLATGLGYKRWTPHALNHLARDYINGNCDQHTVDAVTVAFWGCTMKEAITLVGKGETS